MNLSAATVKILVDAQLTTISDPGLVALVKQLRVAPRVEFRPWQQGGSEAYPCWIVAEHQASDTAVVYCAQGFGPTTPWGLLFLKGATHGMGTASDWFATLEDAIRYSWAIDDLGASGVV